MECGHIEPSEREGYFFVNGGLYRGITDWNFCPICGAKRLEKPKTLSEKLEDAHPLGYKGHDDVWKHQAQAAFDHFYGIIAYSDIDSITVDKIRRKFEASL